MSMTRATVAGARRPSPLASRCSPAAGARSAAPSSPAHRHRASDGLAPRLGDDHRLRRRLAQGDVHRARPPSSRRRTPERPSTLNFAGSSDLVTQITEGAPADVFASADEKNMAKLDRRRPRRRVAPGDFATNVLEIAVPPANPARHHVFADLAKPGVKTVVCAAAGALRVGDGDGRAGHRRRRSRRSARSRRSPTCSARSRRARPTPGSST